MIKLLKTGRLNSGLLALSFLSMALQSLAKQDMLFACLALLALGLTGPDIMDFHKAIKNEEVKNG